ncbi:glycosyltransferase family 2 protein [Brevundimonas sp.]|uniref:glycosyltransferase family 2 protein n=1 Tax=Brevundimonas sp. TaxID=1871086 RepID=UPI0025C515CE|nr:glycosyltransferase family 2 protein [Brevundimonas sp.]
MRLAMADSAARPGLTKGQWIAVAILAIALISAIVIAPGGTGLTLVLLVGAGFVACALWRLLLVMTPRSNVQPVEPLAEWPRYTVLAALHDEAAVVPQLIARLSRLDYPADKLEGFLLLEAHDRATIAAANLCQRPDWLQILVVPSGQPQTKPRALNWGLLHAAGDLVTVYDAEDDPDPLQLKEAAARFAAETASMACLQAPLRIRSRLRARTAAPFLDRQFAAEYAALFEVILPAMARLGLPFPLGGTSNHFRVDVLRAVGGWDAWNVTEDADLGFRLWRHGWRLGMISRPTYETPPERLEVWLPQRTRWLKGYLQTVIVHLRKPLGLGPRGLLALTMTLGMALLAAMTHAPSLAWIISGVLISVRAGISPDLPFHALAVLAMGAISAWGTCYLGARRAGIRYGPLEMASAPAYWSLLTLALIQAIWRLIREPHVWDKTPHQPDTADEAIPVAGRGPA